ncbi:uncharacterized protein BDR25DRAFT_163141, partial [Lindgomyces ingoldianus]
PEVPYELRQNVDRNVATTWIDRDNTGNYDPEEEVKKEKLRKARAKTKKQGKHPAPKQPKEKVQKLIVRLRVESFGNVLNITDNEDNWPSGWSEVDPEEEMERQSRRAFHRQNTPGLQTQTPIPDPKTDSSTDGLAGHPTARGCEDCDAGPTPNHEPKRTHLNTILYSVERKHIECTLCRKEGRRCSLKTKSDRPPCKACQRLKISCTFHDTRYEPAKESQRKKSSTKFSRSTKGNFEKPANAYTHLFTEADLADLEEMDHVELEREDTPELFMEDSEGHHGVVTTLLTSYAHPIVFNAVSASALDCSWCHMPTFGLFGLWERKVHVLRWNNGLGYTELQGGHRESNDKSIMCQACTLSRIQIVLCLGHQVTQSPSKDPDDDFAVVVDHLLSAEPRSEELKYQHQRWCTMCFAVATFKCCTPQPPICDSAEDDGMIFGCGLRFCDCCERRYREEFKGDVDEMATALEKEPKARETTEDTCGTVARADVGFLRQDGLLMANVVKEAE